MNRHTTKTFSSTIILLLLPSAFGADSPRVGVPVEELGQKYELLGHTHKPLGKLLRLQGLVIEGEAKGYEDGPRLLVQRIDGVATEEDIRISLLPFFRDFGKPDGPPTPVKGMTCEVDGYESGEFVGTPGDAYEKFHGNFQDTSFYFKTYFSAGQLKAIDPIHFVPADFAAREALIEGRAVTTDGKGFLNGDGWRLLVKPDSPWSATIEGKVVEAFGLIRRGSDDHTFEVKNAAPRLVRLEDQIDQRVELRGTAWSNNDDGRFNYRGEEIDIDGIKNLPGWKAENHGRPIIIRGILYREKSLGLKKSSRPGNYIVRDASWEPIPNLLSPARSDAR